MINNVDDRLGLMTAFQVQALIPFYALQRALIIQNDGKEAEAEVKLCFSLILSPSTGCPTLCGHKGLRTCVIDTCQPWWLWQEWRKKICCEWRLIGRIRLFNCQSQKAVKRVRIQLKKNQGQVCHLTPASKSSTRRAVHCHGPCSYITTCCGNPDYRGLGSEATNRELAISKPEISSPRSKSTVGHNNEVNDDWRVGTALIWL